MGDGWPSWSLAAPPPRLPPAYPSAGAESMQAPSNAELQAQVNALAAVVARQAQETNGHTATIAQLQVQVASLTKIVHSRNHRRGTRGGKDDVARTAGVVNAEFRAADGAAEGPRAFGNCS